MALSCCQLNQMVFFWHLGACRCAPRLQSFRLRAGCSNLSAPTSSSLRVGDLAATASAFL